MARGLALFQTQLDLEIDPRRNLSRAVAAEIGGACAGDLAKRWVVDGVDRIGQVHMIENICERSLYVELHPLGNGERFAQRRVEIHRSGSRHDAHAGVAEPADGSEVAGRVVADSAGRPGAPVGSARASECRRIEPHSGCGIRDRAVADTVGMLRAVKAGARADGSPLLTYGVS